MQCLRGEFRGSPDSPQHAVQVLLVVLDARWVVQRGLQRPGRVVQLVHACARASSAVDGEDDRWRNHNLAASLRRDSEKGGSLLSNRPGLSDSKIKQLSQEPVLRAGLATTSGQLQERSKRGYLQLRLHHILQSPSASPFEDRIKARIHTSASCRSSHHFP